MRKLLKLGQAGHKICLAVDLDHHTDPTTVDIALDQPFAGLAVALFLRFGQALFAQGIERRVEVTFGLHQRLLGIGQANTS